MNELFSAAKALLLFENKNLLLLRSPDDNIRPSEWDLPGGGPKPEETEREVLIREIKEEAGIDVSSCDTFPVKEWIHEGKNKSRGIDFLCILKKKPEVVLSREHIRSQWFTKEEILEGKEFPDWLKETLTKSLKYSK
ncbi:MAG: NUDIX hydrolase [Candidatus Paceibacterota bacterium]|jgi:8-oxo-dGTP pyrophosphatase MutT (NUDIX family)